ncbi:SRSO17 transposase [Streptomyces prasinopilosus]|uniref:SRSO17 transposase n=2 Tax=Streptomyces prasinopilosus TaxID=67344 RepID=A0A1G7AMW3_9ACTN|nr:SRSO17 transposase [Streptomyces prasinopilosus]
MEGLLSPTLRKSAFALASHAHEAAPDGMQRLLRTAKWDADAVRDDLRSYVLQHTRNENDGILVPVRETFIKKGQHSAGVAWQYSSAHQRMENCQIGQFLGHTSESGSGLIDRELYLPRQWLRDRPPHDCAGLPRDISYTSKAGLNRRMITRALENGLHTPWVSVPEPDLWDESLRCWLDSRQLPYVLRLRSSDALALAPCRMRAEWRLLERRAQHTSTLNSLPWNTLRLRQEPSGRTFWLLIHTSPDTARPHYFICSGPATTTIPELIRAVRAQSAIRQCLDATRADAGLHEYQVRSVTGWNRHTTLSLLAHAFRSFALNAPRPHLSPAAGRGPQAH